MVDATPEGEELLCLDGRNLVRIGRMERATGIEPALSVWKTGALPLSYARVLHLR